MIAFPIPAGEGIPAGFGVLLAIAAGAGFAVIVWQAVRSFRNSGDRHDAFGPPVDDDTKDGDKDDEAP